MDFIKKAKLVVEELRSLDKRCQAFGALQHRYKFNPLLSEVECKSFETAYQLKLPLEYRQYLLELGNGGPGPGYGIKPLSTEGNLHLPFPYQDAFFMDEDEESFDQPLPGAIDIADGGGTDMVLIVKGLCAGQVWYDSRSSEGVFPEMDDKGLPRDFGSWWLFHMEKELAFYSRIAKLMSEGQEFEDIHAQFEWPRLQLHIDRAILSIMDSDPNKRPQEYPDTAWGMIHGLAKEEYERWLYTNPYKES